MTTSTYIVTRVRRERSADGSHRHIAGVCLKDGTYYTREEVVDSVGRGNTWITSGGGCEALIRPVRSCRCCLARPYIEIHPDGTKLDDLENLGEC